MKWWRMWANLFMFYDEHKVSRGYLHYIAWVIAPCHEGWMYHMLPPPANDNVGSSA